MNVRTTGPRVAAGTCLSCGFVNATTDPTNLMTCGGCRVRVSLDFVRGTYNGAVPCNGACQYAVGPNCSCSCGGNNHRRGYIHVEMVPVWVRERDAQRHAAKRERAEQRHQTGAEARRAELLRAYPLLADLRDERYADPTGDMFLYEMHFAFGRGEMSDRQAAAASRSIERARKRGAARAERDKRDAVLRAAGVRVPSGRVTFTGEIVKADRKEEARGRYREATVPKITVRTAEGWIVWGSVPDAMKPSRYNAQEYQAWLSGLRGQTVTLTAEVEPSDRDPLFGFFKRPRLVESGRAGTADAGARERSQVPESARVPTPTPAPVRPSPAVPERVGVARDPWRELIASLG